jgi:hypothetical protein
MGGAVQGAIDGDVNRLGSLLGPMGVRYLIVPHKQAPDSTETIEPPRALTVALEEQLDLAEVELTTALTVYENAAWVPVRAAVPVPGAEAGEIELLGATAVLGDEPSFGRYTGSLEASTQVYVSEFPSDRWHLEVEGSSARADARAEANTFLVEEGGDATLRYDTPTTRMVALALQAALWVLVLVLVVRARVSTEDPLT